ncbi:MAG: serine/threonine protein kinase [Bryobacterales bacterium]|nr:serine/threonine protein kinase [Bryobacterales bacterium]
MEPAHCPRVEGLPAQWKRGGEKLMDYSKWLGKRIGVWRLDRLVRTGGRALIFRAERVEGEYAQTVVVKMPKPGVPGWEIERERDYLQQLRSSPYFPRLFEGGVLENSQTPFIVMEHIRGERIDVFADERGLDIPKRLDLFKQLCQAIDYLHKQSIGHLDLKPANVLVTLDGSVKLIDFGTACRLDELHCTSDSDLLTLEYASPERVGDGQQLALSADVYGATSILFLLLTGRTPLQLSEREPECRIRALREEDPPPASQAAFAASSKDWRIARFRRAAPDVLREQLRGNLDELIAIGLAKTLTQRYATGSLLLESVSRVCEGKPPRKVTGRLGVGVIDMSDKQQLWAVAASLVLLSMLAAFFVHSLASLSTTRSRQQRAAFLPILREQAEWWRTMLRPALATDSRLIEELRTLDEVISRTEAETGGRP